jgi:DNA polymerase-3 subunit alpha
MAGIERALAAGASRMADRKSGQKSLFDALDDAPQAAAAPPPATLPDVPSLTDLEMRSAEKEVLGYYVHSHPLAEYKDILSAVCTTPVISVTPSRRATWSSAVSWEHSSCRT